MIYPLSGIYVETRRPISKKAYNSSVGYGLPSSYSNTGKPTSYQTTGAGQGAITGKPSTYPNSNYNSLGNSYTSNSNSNSNKGIQGAQPTGANQQSGGVWDTAKKFGKWYTKSVLDNVWSMQNNGFEFLVPGGNPYTKALGLEDQEQ